MVEGVTNPGTGACRIRLLEGQAAGEVYGDIPLNRLRIGELGKKGSMVVCLGGEQRGDRGVFQGLDGQKAIVQMRGDEGFKVMDRGIIGRCAV